MITNRWFKLRWTTPLILLFTTLLDAAWPAVFPKAFIGNNQIIISHITLYFIILFAFYFKDNVIIMNAFIFGLFADGYNSTVLGVYGTIYLIVAWVVTQIRRFFPKNGLIHFLLFMIMITLVDFIVYLFQVMIIGINYPIVYFITNRLAPTIVFNIVVFLALHIPKRSLLRWLGWDDFVIF